MSYRDAMLDELDSIFSRIGRLTRRMVAKDANMTFGQFAVLRLLFQSGPLPMGSLAEQLDVSLAGATGVIDRLVQAGMVERRRSEEDRRMVWVDLSAFGRQKMLDLQRSRHEYMGLLLAPLSEPELKTLVSLLERVASSVEQRFPAGIKSSLGDSESEEKAEKGEEEGKEEG